MPKAKHLGKKQSILFKECSLIADNPAIAIQHKLEKFDLNNNASEVFSPEYRKIHVANNRIKALRNNWTEIYKTVTTILKLEIRMNLRTSKVEIRTTKAMPDVGILQKAADYIEAFLLGFELKDCVALLRLDGIFIDSFQITDIKMLKGDHLSRCIGRICGKNGKTKFAIENTTQTRIVIADTKINILGSFLNIKAAKGAINNLVLGSPASKVYSKLRTVTNRLKESY